MPFPSGIDDMMKLTLSFLAIVGLVLSSEIADDESWQAKDEHHLKARRAQQQQNSAGVKRRPFKTQERKSKAEKSHSHIRWIANIKIENLKKFMVE